MKTIQDAINTLVDKQPLLAETLCLQLTAMRLNIYSNSQPLLTQLRHYFRHLVTTDGDGGVAIIAIEQPPLSSDLEHGLPWQDWQREAGKSGRKDAYINGDGFRLIHKVRTGMVFLQSSTHRIAAGPCEANVNQVINFIINQKMSALQHQGWLICHAAAAVKNGQALALAGFSGGGKSTLMLHLMANAQWKFVTNDRLFIKHTPTGVVARGVPKLPRVNPGTLLHNSQLRTILTPQRISELESMPINTLWNLEEKYDVDVLEQYGNGRIQHQADLSAFIVLNWSHGSTIPTTISRVNLDQCPQLLDAIMKSAGPFYQQSDGSFYQNNQPLVQEKYREILSEIKIFEVAGKVDFAHLRKFCDSVLVPSHG
ncbi:MAG: HprK-related kinase B [Mariprofundales bacterium]